MNAPARKLITDPLAITDTTTFNWAGKDKPIIHRVLTFSDRSDAAHDGANVSGLPSRSIVFTSKPGSLTGKTADTESQMRQLAIPQARKRAHGLSKQKGKTPFDIPVCQSWLVIQLDPGINWRFANDRLACRLKEPESVYGPDPSKIGWNVNLRNVYPTGFVTADPSAEDPDMIAQQDHCRLIYFGVVHRGGLTVNPPKSQLFNLNVEFYQDVGITGQPINVLPLMIDPDVGNDGNTEFPSPP